MNEAFGIDPACCSSPLELKLLLEKFGPRTGRYVVTFPSHWHELVEEHFATQSVMSRKRASDLLIAATERKRVIRRSRLDWNAGLDWRKNVLAQLQASPPSLSAAIVATNGESNRGIHDLDSLDLPPTAEEPITARKDEFLRVSDTLLRISKEIWIVDPYLDPTQRRVGTVLEVLFKRIGQVAAASSPRRVTCIARAMTVLDDRGNSADDIIASMKQLTAAFGSGDVEFHYVLVNDRQSRDTLHDRFLFSVMGGIKSSHGFQELSGGRKVNISPVSEGEHKNLTRLFKEQQHDFNVMFDHRIRVNARG